MNVYHDKHHQRDCHVVTYIWGLAPNRPENRNMASHSSCTIDSTFKDTIDASFYTDVDTQDLGGMDFDTHPCPTSLTTSTRHFATRVPIREDGNPRGKYPRKPLHWPAFKLASVVSWEWDAERYRIRLWQWEVEQQQKRQRQQSNKQEASEGVSPQQNTASNGSKNKPDISRSRPNNTDTAKKTKNNNRTAKKNKDLKKTRKERMKARKSKMEKTKPIFEKPHYLTALDAMHSKQGFQKYWVSCPICKKIDAEWDSEMKRKSKDLAMRREDGLCEAFDDDIDLDVLEEHNCPVCFPFLWGRPGDPECDHDIDMGEIVKKGDLMREEAYRVRYVDRIRGRKRGGKRVKGQQGMRESEPVVCDIDLPKGDSHETEAPWDWDNASEEISEEWGCLDGDSMYDGSPGLSWDRVPLIWGRCVGVQRAR